MSCIIRHIGGPPGYAPRHRRARRLENDAVVVACYGGLLWLAVVVALVVHR
jgi:hypothetical protein